MHYAPWGLPSTARNILRVAGGNASWALNRGFGASLEPLSTRAFSPEPYQPMDRGEGLYRLIEGSLATDWDFPWEKLRLPVLSMTGLHDRVFYVAADVEALAARIAGLQRVEFADAGHLVPLERPREFSAALLAFARRLQ